MIAIAAAMPAALLLWLAIAYLVPPLAAMDMTLATLSWRRCQSWRS